MCLPLPLSSLGILSMHHHANPCRCGFWALSSGLHACRSISGAMTHPGLVPLHCAQLKGIVEGKDGDEDRDIMGRKVIGDKGAFWVRQLYKWQEEKRECAFPIYSLHFYVFRSLIVSYILGTQ